MSLARPAAVRSSRSVFISRKAISYEIKKAPVPKGTEAKILIATCVEFHIPAYALIITVRVSVSAYLPERSGCPRKSIHPDPKYCLSTSGSSLSFLPSALLLLLIGFSIGSVSYYTPRSRPKSRKNTAENIVKAFLFETLRRLLPGTPFWRTADRPRRKNPSEDPGS